jgi:hypothetical protein
MKMQRCQCGVPGAQICLLHKTIFISPWRFWKMRTKTQVYTLVCRFKWWLARLALGHLYYNTAFTCPKCGNEYCPARPEEIK